VGDLWPEAPVQMGIVKNSLLKWFLYKLENSIYKRADAVVALSEAIKKEIQIKVPGKAIHVIPNMADTDFYKPIEKDKALEEKYGVQKKFVISYIGTMGIANGLDCILHCAATSLMAGLNIHFILCGEGAETHRLQHAVETIELTNISFLPFQNREGVREVMNITDAIFISFRPLPVLETGSPNKYFDGLSAAKLIVSNVGGWIQKEIEQNKCGVYLNPNQPKEFVEKIRPFINQPALLLQYQTSARKLAEETYSRKLLSEKFQKLFI